MRCSDTNIKMKVSYLPDNNNLHTQTNPFFNLPKIRLILLLPIAAAIGRLNSTISPINNWISVLTYNPKPRNLNPAYLNK